MTPYDIYNLVFAVFVLPFSYWIVGSELRVRHLILSARIASLLTIIYYPWDFFAIHLGVWTYPSNPGVRIYQVPLNDLIFIWLCSFLTCSALALSWRLSRPKGRSNA